MFLCPICKEYRSVPVVPNLFQRGLAFSPVRWLCPECLTWIHPYMKKILRSLVTKSQRTLLDHLRPYGVGLTSIVSILVTMVRRKGAMKADEISSSRFASTCRKMGDACKDRYARKPKQFDIVLVRATSKTITLPKNSDEWGSVSLQLSQHGFLVGSSSSARLKCGLHNSITTTSLTIQRSKSSTLRRMKR